jgi:adenylate cyclase
VSGADLARQMRRRLAGIAILANGGGALVVFLFLLVVPATDDPGTAADLTLVGGIVGGVYTALGLAAGISIGLRRYGWLGDWLESDRPAGDREREAVLEQPRYFARLSAQMWGGGALVLGAVLFPINAQGASVVAVTIVLGGLTTCATAYLMVERAFRPVTARALASGVPERPVAPGITARITMTWVLATGVPVLGAAVLAVSELAEKDLDRTLAAAATLCLAGLTLVVGLFAIVMAARSVADPVAAVRSALARVEAGDFGARIEVDDSSDLGLLEAGFNRMAGGLAERESLRDLFGRHVGRDVARAALEGGAELGGEERHAAALFVDLVGSVSLPARHTPAEVVALLNRFCAIVVDAVEARGGLVNKFQGDAVLCVFGAPVRRPDAAGDALAAARDMRARLARELPDLDMGIGVSAGTVVAGNVGSEQRYEYTVIGDPVNEAARLCELAKTRPERVLASEAVVREARHDESGHWELGDVVTLRGRDSETRLATPAAAG